ncbi:MAG: FAD-binding protein [Elusimicrobia bacterium]|nr:FAD-binding protein [Elusimicrobiota bacterium]
MIRSLESLEEVLIPRSLLTSEADLAAYSYDGALDRGRPDAVVLACSAEEVRRAVQWCVRHKVPFTARGAGTNLSGGCIPLRGGLLIALARLDKILAVDTARRWAVVEPGVVNLSLQKALADLGCFYAPDPASFKVSTLGGNLAENAGGPRCLKYGTTTNHVLAVEAVMPDASVQKFDLSEPGPELASLLVGAEGTLGIVVKAWLKILPLPGNIRTLLAGFSSIDAAVECVSAIVAAGVLPRVLEALDRTTVESVEAYSHAGYPQTEAVLLIEVDGEEREVKSDSELVEGLCRKHGASVVRSAQDEAQREKLWEGRRGAYAAMARLAPNVMVEDGVVPRDKLPEVVRRIQEIVGKYRLRAGLLFHAGDGNIHPNIAYDERDRDETDRVKAAGREILQACVELGGSLSGEHGIGVDKREAMAWLFTPETLDLFRRIKRELDPDNLANPDKLFPLSSDKAGPGLIKPPSPSLSEQAQHLISKVRQYAAENRTMSIAGSGSRLRDVPEGHVSLLTTSLNRIVDLDKRNYTLTVEAGISPYELHMKLKKEGCFIRLPDCGGTLGGLLAAKANANLRDDLLGMRLLLADGTVVELGGKVVKNVAGYDVPRLLLGSWGTLGVILEATFKLYGRPQEKPAADPAPKPFTPGSWHRKIKKAFDPKNLLNPWFFSEG